MGKTSLDHENIGRGIAGKGSATAIAIIAFTIAIAIAIAGVKVGVMLMMMMMMRMHIRHHGAMGHGSRSEFSEIGFNFVSIFDFLLGHWSITLLQTRREDRAHVLAFINVEDSGN